MKKTGRIKIHRSSQDSDMYFCEPFTKRQAWIDLLLLANHKDGIISVRGNIIHVKRGQCAYSQDTLGERRKRSRGKVFRYLETLETIQQIIQQKSKLKTIITIINYDKYQGNSTTDDTTDSTTDDTTDSTRTRMIENDKKNKEERGSSSTRSVFQKPTIDELKDYCKENNIFIDCDGFFDYYESNGWMVGKNKMKSWSATIKNRARRDKKSGTYKDPADEDRNNYKKLLIENRLQETQGNHDETRQKKLRGVAQGMIAKYTEEKVREYRKKVLSSL